MEVFGLKRMSRGRKDPMEGVEALERENLVF
jgi:hypothetical protein